MVIARQRIDKIQIKYSSGKNAIIVWLNNHQYASYKREKNIKKHILHRKRREQKILIFDWMGVRKKVQNISWWRQLIRYQRKDRKPITNRNSPESEKNHWTYDIDIKIESLLFFSLVRFFPFILLSSDFLPFTWSSAFFPLITFFSQIFCSTR